MTKIVGEVSRVGRVDCDIACPRAVGPIDADGQITQTFVDWSIRRLAHGVRFSPHKVRRHLDATRLYLPPELPALRLAYAELLAADPSVRLYLTGSAILTPERPLKDLDVVAMVSGPEAACRLGQFAPRSIEIAGVRQRVDTFWMTSECAVYAMVAFDLSEALVWNPATVDAPCVQAIRRPDVTPLAQKLHDLAQRLPVGSGEPVKRSGLPPQAIPDGWSPEDEREGCCDKPTRSGVRNPAPEPRNLPARL